MDEQPEVIEHEMDETRHSLAEKLGALEGQVAESVTSTTHAVQGAVEGTSTAVADTAETVKETVENVSEKVKESVAAMAETVEAVKDGVQDACAAVSGTVHQAAAYVGEALNLGLQAERRPWIVFGGSVVAGCVGGYLFGQAFGRPSGRAARRPSSGYAAAAPRPAEAPSGRGGFQLPGWLSEELGRLRNVAIGAAMGVVRDLVRQNLPGQLGERIAQEIDNVNGKLGGEKFSGPLMPNANNANAEKPYVG
jgi:gas vesicle protein